MKQNKTPLHFAQQLEDFQTTRKAKEVNEIYTFDTLKESLKQRQLTLNRRMEKLRRKPLQQGIEEPEIAEEQIVLEKAKTFQELAEFDRQAYDRQMHAEDNEFETIAEIQGFRYQSPEVHQGLKQLPEAHADAFAHELNALTERELQKELELNEKALQESLKKPERLDLSSEPPMKEPESQTASIETRERGVPELQENPSETEPEAQEKTDREEDVPENQAKQESGNSLIYFRSNPPPPEEGS